MANKGSRRAADSIRRARACRKRRANALRARRTGPHHPTGHTTYRGRPRSRGSTFKPGAHGADARGHDRARRSARGRSWASRELRARWDPRGDVGARGGRDESRASGRSDDLGPL